MTKIVLINKFPHNAQPMALVLMRSQMTREKALLPYEHEISDDRILNVVLKKSSNGTFLFGYFKEPLEFGFPLDLFKPDYFDYDWIDLEKFYDNPLEYVQKGRWTQMDKEDFLIFIKNKSEILEYFDRAKSA